MNWPLLRRLKDQPAYPFVDRFDKRATLFGVRILSTLIALILLSSSAVAEEPKPTKPVDCESALSVPARSHPAWNAVNWDNVNFKDLFQLLVLADIPLNPGQIRSVYSDQVAQLLKENFGIIAKGKTLVDELQRRYGSFDQAQIANGFHPIHTRTQHGDMNRVRFAPTTPEQLLEGIRALSKAKVPLGSTEMEKDESMASKVVLWNALKIAITGRALYFRTIRQYGSWPHAKKAAGIVEIGPEPLPMAAVTDSLLLRALTLLSKIYPDMRQSALQPHDAEIAKFLMVNVGRAMTVRELAGEAISRFGNWVQALKKANVDTTGMQEAAPPVNWTREKLIQAIQTLAKYFPKLSNAVLRANNEKVVKLMKEQFNQAIGTGSIMRAADELFGTWPKAIQASGLIVTDYLSPSKPKNWSRGFMLDAIQVIHLKFPDMNRDNLIAHSRDIGELSVEKLGLIIDPKILIDHAVKEFGTWELALKSAGFNDTNIPITAPQIKVATTPVRQNKEIDWSRSSLLALIRAIHEKCPDMNIDSLKARRNELAEVTTTKFGRIIALERIVDLAAKEFGSWIGALSEAGLDVSNIGWHSYNVKWTAAKVLKVIKVLKINMNSLEPSLILASSRQMAIITSKELGETIGPRGLFDASRKYFGTWARAVKAAGFESPRQPTNPNPPLSIATVPQILMPPKVDWSRGSILDLLRLIHAKCPDMNIDILKTQCKELKEITTEKMGREISLRYIVQMAAKDFGSWLGALSEAGFDISNIRWRSYRVEWTSAKVLKVIKALKSGMPSLEWTSLRTNGQRMAILTSKQFGELIGPQSGLLEASQKYFGSWIEAVKAAGFDSLTTSQPNALPRSDLDWSRDSLLGLIRSIHGICPDMNIDVLKTRREDLAGVTTAKFNTVVSLEVIVQRSTAEFGSWIGALSEAGIDISNIRWKSDRGIVWTAKKVLKVIKILKVSLPSLRWSSLLQHNREVAIITSRELGETIGPKGLFEAAKKYFGSWPGAVESAGFETSDLTARLAGMNWSEDLIKDVLYYLYKNRVNLALHKFLANPRVRTLTLKQYRVQMGPSAIFHAVMDLYGSWPAAREAAGVPMKIERRDHVTSDIVLMPHTVEWEEGPDGRMHKRVEFGTQFRNPEESIMDAEDESTVHSAIENLSEDGAKLSEQLLAYLEENDSLEDQEHVLAFLSTEMGRTVTWPEVQQVLASLAESMNE